MKANTFLFYALALGVIAAPLALSGCAKPREAKGVMDTPEHHVLRGNDFLDKNNVAAAETEFGLALSLDKKHSQAHAGMAVVEAAKGDARSSKAEAREKAFDLARGHYKDALSYVRDKDDERVGHMAAVRAMTLTQLPKDWLEEAEDHYQDALDADKAGAHPDTHFYMARAWMMGFEFDKALNLYEKVLAMDKGLAARADKEMELVQKIVRARPGTRYGKQVALLEKVSRADVAALFIGELQLEQIYSRNPKFDNSFKAPGQGGAAAGREPADTAGHPLANDINEVLRLDISGLGLDGAGRFNPDKPLSRAEFAMMVEDILVKVTDETSLKTKFIGAESPFRDVRSDLPYFNAVMSVTSRDLMQPRNKVRAIFGPTENLEGVDALLVIRALKNELRSYLR